MNRSKRLLPVLLVATASLIASTGAYGQDALGAGDVLDSNLDAIGGRVNTRVTGPDYRSRNLLVTGNVAGGRGFRGSVGYGGEDDFRGRLGSDDTYSFRAQSAFSAPDLLQVGRMSNRLAFGQDMGVVEFRRDTAGSSIAAIESGAKMTGGLVLPKVSTTLDARSRLDRMSQALSMRVQMDQGAEPQLVSMIADEKGDPLLASTSSLRGLKLQRPEASLQRIGLTSYDVLRLQDDVREGLAPQGLGQPFQPDYRPSDTRRGSEKEEPTGAPGSVDRMTPDSRIDSRVGEDAALDTARTTRIDREASGYRAIVDRVADLYTQQKGEAGATDRTGMGEAINTEMQTLRDRLIAPPGRRMTSSTTTEPMLEPGEDGATPVPPRRSGVEEFSTLPPEMEDSAAAKELRRRMDPKAVDQHKVELPDATRPGGRPDTVEEQLKAMPTEELAIALRHGARLDALTSREKDRFNELMASAEDRLRAGEYFQAENRFVRALRFTPEHPLATAGLAHAQMGAGLYLSSAFTIRSLMRKNPEMIDTRYDEGLLPSRVRMLTAVDSLREQIGNARTKNEDRAAQGLLMAYIGHQLGDPTLVEEGLGVMGQFAPDEPLLPVLRSVWQGKPGTGAGAAKTPAQSPEAVPATPGSTPGK